ncbi:F-box only protein 15 isoform X1 [Trichosurus vulpecula]|uniref:F-box only protein 15 isoform X1 n=2 Tax=Trichosurus vulpecula TaxID=9337 RepID=UPI00186AD5C2|nr:F-box only protein 15 isoform X1 [Trichosurus vulpecula]
MATGRGWILRQHCKGLVRAAEEIPWQLRLPPVDAAWASPPAPLDRAPGPYFFRRPSKGSDVMLNPKPSEQSTMCERHCAKSSSKLSMHIEGMPSEILLKIFSYLDAVTLLCIGCVNKRFYSLANDNFIWFRIYSASFSPKRSNWEMNAVEKTAVSLSHTSLHDKETGYWKKKYIVKQIAAGKTAVTQLLKPVNPYTGLPVKTKEALRVSGLSWVIVLKEKNGKEYIMEQAEFSVNDTSVTVMWHGNNWPRIDKLATLDLCGVTPVFLDRYKVPTKNGPRRRSLVAEYNLTNLTKSTSIGSDRLIRTFCLNPGLLVGIWKKEKEMAFVMANLHFHLLVERSTLGSATVPYMLPPHIPFLDDIDQQYGLHGYQLHVDMHSGGSSYLCGTFRNLFSRKDFIKNGYMKLIVISFKNNAQHLPLIGKVGLCWKTDVFAGCIQNCYMMDVTLLDETEKPFWCFSSPVCMRPATRPSDFFNYRGRHFYVTYIDSVGKVNLELVWMEETEEYYVVSLALYLRIERVNSWFGTNY